MKHCTFVYKLNIYFNRRIRNWSVKLTQPKLNTEEIKLFWSWTLWCILAWKLACFTISFVLFWIYCLYISVTFTHIYFYVLVIIKRTGLLHYTLLTWKTGMLALHSTPFWSGLCSAKLLKTNYTSFFTI